MKKIKTLHWFIIFLIIVYIFHFITNIYLIFFTPDFMDFLEEVYEYFILGYYTQFVFLPISLIVFLALIFLKKGLRLTIKNGFLMKII
ncbi:hypothetical protein ES677_07075 [Bizionia gelidisalsuginis]|uniref:Uncharacterized protein n=2 Tax=Bizionia TaxID=283785 RepID=A0A8H2LDQ6_9FLAO|nr:MULTISPECIES: hypothetical protein [Bizionia]TYB75985.1 hypothetical protein ES676_05915 [Bizionia saleffrena]TYC13488.1 hypothetical protein ES677_07075 [Bizionia gelidisalsuginis]